MAEEEVALDAVTHFLIPRKWLGDKPQSAAVWQVWGVLAYSSPNSITVTEISLRTKLSTRTVRRAMKSLADQKMLDSDRGKRWEESLFSLSYDKSVHPEWTNMPLEKEQPARRSGQFCPPRVDNSVIATGTETVIVEGFPNEKPLPPKVPPRVDAGKKVTIRQAQIINIYHAAISEAEGCPGKSPPRCMAVNPKRAKALDLLDGVLDGDDAQITDFFRKCVFNPTWRYPVKWNGPPGVEWFITVHTNNGEGPPRYSAIIEGMSSVSWESLRDKSMGGNSAPSSAAQSFNDRLEMFPEEEPRWQRDEL